MRRLDRRFIYGVFAGGNLMISYQYAYDGHAWGAVVFICVSFWLTWKAH